MYDAETGYIDEVAPSSSVASGELGGDPAEAASLASARHAARTAMQRSIASFLAGDMSTAMWDAQDVVESGAAPDLQARFTLQIGLLCACSGEFQGAFRWLRHSATIGVASDRQLACEAGALVQKCYETRDMETLVRELREWAAGAGIGLFTPRG